MFEPTNRSGESDAAALALLGGIGVERAFVPGAFLYTERDPPKAVFLLRSGAVKLSCEQDSGKELILGFRGVGALLGSASIVTGRPHAHSAVALKPLRALEVPQRAFSQAASNSLPVATLLNRQCSAELHDCLTQRAVTALVPAKTRLLHLLHAAEAWAGSRDEEADAGNSPQLTDRAQLASVLGITATHLSRLLRALEDEGAIARNGRKIIRVGLAQRSVSSK